MYSPEEIIEFIRRGFYVQDLVDFSALILGLCYVLLLARGKRIGWIAGIASCVLILWKDISQYRLWADAGLQLFYIAMGFIALWYWRRGEKSETPGFTPEEWPLSKHLMLISGGFILSFLMGKWLAGTPAALPFTDSVSSVFAVLATWLMVLKLKSNWIYWIFIDGLYIYIYSRQQAYYFTLLSLVYLVLAVYGYYSWSQISAGNQRLEP